MAQTAQKTTPTTSPQNPVSPQKRRLFRPAVDAIESAGGVTVRVDLPGVDEKSLEVTVDRNVLTIRGRAQPPEHQLQPLLQEFEAGEYVRQFTLSDDLDPDGIEATFKNGVLTLTLPRSQAVGPRKVPVKTA